MGQTLSEPITTKETEGDSDNRLWYGVSSMQGWRISMEDAHTTILNLDDNAFFAVFDGHGGSNVAIYSGKKLHAALQKLPEYESKDYKVALKKVFLQMDVDMLNDPQYAEETSGCTAVSALITSDWKVIVANAGDSRCIVSCGGEAIPLSYDHKPTNELETKRITEAGGFVEYGRVNGNLALSRAIGDFDFKKNPQVSVEKQIVTADPEIMDRTLTSDDEFIVLACDGIWDCMSNQEVVDFVRVKVAETNGDLGKVCEDMMDYCLAPDCDLGSIGCDNMTVIVVAILMDKTKQEWVDSISKKVSDTNLTIRLQVEKPRAGPPPVEPREEKQEEEEQQE